jgi:hypothetical protein
MVHTNENDFPALIEGMYNVSNQQLLKVESAALGALGDLGDLGDSGDSGNLGDLAALAECKQNQPRIAHLGQLR